MHGDHSSFQGGWRSSIFKGWKKNWQMEHGNPKKLKWDRNFLVTKLNADVELHWKRYYNSFKLWLFLLLAFDRSEKYARQCRWFFPGFGVKIPKDKMPCESWNEVKYFWWKKSGQPVDMLNIPLFTRFYTSQVVVWDFFHQQYPLGWRESSSRCCPNLPSLGFLFKKKKGDDQKFSNEGIRCMVICHIEMCIFNLYGKIGASWTHQSHWKVWRKGHLHSPDFISFPKKSANHPLLVFILLTSCLSWLQHAKRIVVQALGVIVTTALFLKQPWQIFYGIWEKAFWKPRTQKCNIFTDLTPPKSNISPETSETLEGFLLRCKFSGAVKLLQILTPKKLQTKC